jgi:hypothetical protein
MILKQKLMALLATIAMVLSLGFVSMPAQAATASPLVSGTTQVGSTLTVSLGKWDATPAPRQQWFRNGLAIRGATSASYTLTASDYLKEITVVVMGKRSKKDAVEFAPLLPLIAAGPETPANNGRTIAQIFLNASNIGSSCALLPNGQVQCIEVVKSQGSALQKIHAPVTVAGLSRVVQIAASSSYMCALIIDGTVSCWGPQYIGPPNKDPNPKGKVTKIAGLTNVRALAIGSTVCALIKDGSEKCFGNGGFGQLGTAKLDLWNSSFGPVYYKNTPQVMTGIKNAIQISSAYWHNCALISNGDVSCWGSNQYAAMGVKASRVLVKTPVVVKGLSNVLQVAVSNGSTCVVLVSGKAKCWGYNKTTKVDVKIIGNAAVDQLALNNDSACAVLANGEAQCWGDNSQGQLTGIQSDGPMVLIPYTATPIVVPLARNAISLGQDIMEGWTNCAILDDGTGYCWGQNSNTSNPVSVGLYLFTPRPVDLFGTASSFVAETSPRITGQPSPGQTLTATVGTYPEGTILSYNWYAGAQIAKSSDSKSSVDLADALTFVVPTENLAYKTPIYLQVVARIPGYRALMKDSNTLKSDLGPVPITSTPVVTSSNGTFVAGATLTANPGAWSQGAKFTYVWNRDGVAIAGQTKTTYLITAADVGHAITVSVTGNALQINWADDPYLPVTKTSEPVSISG